MLVLASLLYNSQSTVYKTHLSRLAPPRKENRSPVRGVSEITRFCPFSVIRQNI